VSATVEFRVRLPVEVAHDLKRAARFHQTSCASLLAEYASRALAPKKIPGQGLAALVSADGGPRPIRRLARRAAS
jgi:hypothetical protein